MNRDDTPSVLMDILYLAVGFFMAASAYHTLGTGPWVRVLAIAMFLSTIGFGRMWNWWLDRLDPEVPDGEARS